MPGNVKHLDTKNFNDTITAYANHIKQFEAIVLDVNNAANEVVDRWKGKGRNQFEKDCKQVQLNLKDISEIMHNLKDALDNAHKKYIESDMGLSSGFNN
jgi:WXG100 family type VII secretion target